MGQLKYWSIFYYNFRKVIIFALNRYLQQKTIKLFHLPPPSARLYLLPELINLLINLRGAKIGVVFFGGYLAVYYLRH